jgi:hypothetical protein
MEIRQNIRMTIKGDGVRTRPRIRFETIVYAILLSLMPLYAVFISMPDLVQASVGGGYSVTSNLPGGLALYRPDGQQAISGNSPLPVYTIASNSGSKPLVQFTATDFFPDISALTINSTSDKVAVSFAGCTNIAATHSLYLPASRPYVYICPSATTVQTIAPGCAGQVSFNHAECVQGTTRSTLTCTVEGGYYKVSGLTSTGMGLSAGSRLFFWDRGNGSLSVGDNANATGYAAVALGNGDATGELSLAASGGYATGNYSIAMGLVSYSNSTSSVAIGPGASARRDSAVAVGDGATVLGANGMALGYRSRAIGTGALAAGYMANATGNYAIAIGYSPVATNTYAISLGYLSNASGQYSAVIGGTGNTASGDYSAVLGGSVNTASGSNSVAMGEYVVASGYDSTAIGSYLTNPTDSSFAVGFGDITLNVTDNLVKVVGDVNATGRICDGSGNCISSLASQPYWVNAAGSITSNASINGGRVNVTGDLYVVGSMHGGGADFAEKLPVSEEVAPGDVVCLGDDLKVSRCAAEGQASVVGVVSSYPTVTGNSGSSGVAVGVVGIVETNVKGPVARFDLLTSAPGGFAQKATIADFGAIVGKAMEPCPAGECRIKVLVTLG